VPEHIDAADFESVLVVTTRTIDIGDADDWDTMHLPSGNWLAQVAVIPVDAPDHVEILFSPTSPTAPRQRMIADPGVPQCRKVSDPSSHLRPVGGNCGYLDRHLVTGCVLRLKNLAVQLG
jgi:hypothetical protein